MHSAKGKRRKRHLPKAELVLLDLEKRRDATRLFCSRPRHKAKGPYRRRERYGGRSTRLSVPSSFSNELSASTKDDIVYSVRCGTEGMHTSIVSLTKRFVHLKRRESIWFRKCPHTKIISIT